MEGFMTDSRNIIIVKGEKIICHKKNQYAAPKMFSYFRKTGADILAILKKHPEIIQIIRRTEIEECQRINKKLLDPK
jgi:hypothetical protein